MKNLFFTIILFLSGVTFAQKVKVLDQQTGKIIKNTSIFNDKETINITTDINGFADISEFKDTEIVIFSHLSYAVLRVKKAVIKSRNYSIYLTKESEQLDEVVISLFKKEEKTARIAEQIAVLNAKDIQKISPQTSADLLATIPGIKVQKSQFGGGSPVIRGMESNRVLLVVDGVRMNNAIYRKGHLQSSITVTPNMLDKTEVVFGPSSVVYGSDALGGVIHYYTKTPKLSQENEVKSQLFSRFSTVNQEVTTNVSAEVRRKNWASLTSISYSDFGDLKAGTNRSHGFNDWGRVHFFSENLNGNYSENPTENTNSNIQRNTGYKQTDLLQKFFVPLSKDTDLKVNLQYSTSSDIPRFDRLAELKDGELKFAEWFYGPQKRFLASTQFILNPSKKWVESGIITAAYQNIQESRIQRKFGSLDRSYREEMVAVYSLNGDFSISLTEDKRRTLSYGFEFAYNDVNSNAIGKELNIVNGEIAGFSNNFKVQSRYPDGGSNYSSAAVYLDYRQDLNSKSTLNSGIRFTNTNLNATWIDQTFIQLAETIIHANHSDVTATVGYVYKPNKNWQINSVVSSGFRSPNIDDIGRVREKAGNVTIPNIHVTPEFAYNVEIGVQKYFNDKKFRFGANIYYTLLDNYIQRDFVYNSDGSIQQVEFDNEFGNAVSNQNKDKAYITGYTANYLGKISSAWRTSGFVTYTKGRTYDTNEPMSSIPPLFGQFEVNYKVDKLELGAALRFNSKKDIADFNITEGIDNHDLTPIVNANITDQIAIYAGSPSWVTVGLNSRLVVSNNFSVLARFDNLLDQHYIEFASGVASPGRNLSISFMANF
jgi:hemoglobin/transferrin/lactoferrin receptor protein|tara:strand:- start:1045 stop:3519 length:2475 start_codon:yes stop_codon:yes gene_type:complete